MKKYVYLYIYIYKYHFFNYKRKDDTKGSRSRIQGFVKVFIVKRIYFTNRVINWNFMEIHGKPLGKQTKINIFKRILKERIVEAPSCSHVFQDGRRFI